MQQLQLLTSLPSVRLFFAGPVLVQCLLMALDIVPQADTFPSHINRAISKATFQLLFKQLSLSLSLSNCYLPTECLS